MSESKLYDIKDAARHLGLPSSTLRYWEREGLVQCERNDNNDYRQYDMHDLIDVSEIAFYRRLGVPVKDLRNYRTMSIHSLDDALQRTEYDVEHTIQELESMRTRLSLQRKRIACALELRQTGMRHGTPTLNTLSTINYEDERTWQLLVDEQWRYGIFVSASNPALAHETIVDTAQEGATTLWRRDQAHKTLEKAWECLLCVQPNGNLTNARELFSEAVTRGANPSCIIGSYLLTASEGSGTTRWDYYHSWVL